MYYRLYDLQTGCHMATGCNTESRDELVEQFKDYWSDDLEEEDKEYFNNLTTDEVIQFIKDNEFTIEESEEQFPDDDNEEDYEHTDFDEINFI
jgi:hypothetical protein